MFSSPVSILKDSNMYMREGDMYRWRKLIQCVRDSTSRTSATIHLDRVRTSFPATTYVRRETTACAISRAMHRSIYLTLWLSWTVAYISACRSGSQRKISFFRVNINCKLIPLMMCCLYSLPVSFSRRRNLIFLHA